MSEPFVSVVTPFHNTAPYLEQCIDSVLEQTCQNFEYLLVDNCSTDGSGEIAEEYAGRDGRIRLIRQPHLLSQVQNYNRALEHISERSRYCKIVQADDFIFPECLRSTIQIFEQSESIGLVSSYWLKGNELRGSGFPYDRSALSGKEVARLYLRTGLWVFGSPTAVMYRSSIIREDKPFYDESQLHEDTQKCMEILKHWDFGFVHQVLSFSRLENQSISSAVRGFHPNDLDRYITVTRHASAFLEPEEAATLKRNSKGAYYRVLAHQALRSRDSAFWKYHKKGLSTLGEKVERSYLALQIGRILLWNVGNPLAATAKAFGVLKRKIVSTESAENVVVSTKNLAPPSAGATNATDHL